MDTISDLYLLTTGQKKVLALEYPVNMNEVYQEAYSLDLWIDVEDVEHIKQIFIEKMDKVKPTAIARQLIGVLLFGEEKSVTYKPDNVNLRTLQTTAYRLAKNQGLNIDTRFVFGQLVMTLKTVKFGAIDAMLKPLKVGQTTTVPLSMHSTTARLRSYITAFGRKHDCKYKTNVQGNVMIVTRVDELDSVSFGPASSMFSDKPDDFRKWLDIIPFDAKISASEAFPTLDVNHMRVLANRRFGSCVSIDGNKNVIKKSLSKGTEKGMCVIRVNGYLLFSGQTFDKETINQLLEIHGKTYEDIE